MTFFEKVLLANKEGLPEYLFSDRYHFLKFRNYYEQTNQFYKKIISSYHGQLYVLNRWKTMESIVSSKFTRKNSEVINS